MSPPLPPGPLLLPQGWDPERQLFALRPRFTAEGGPEAAFTSVTALGVERVVEMAPQVSGPSSVDPYRSTVCLLRRTAQR